VTGLTRSNLDPELAQRPPQSALEFCIDMFQQFALLIVDQRRLLAVVDRDRQCGLLNIATPATLAQRFGKLPAQALGDGQL